MKLERLPEYLSVLVVSCLGAGLALYSGLLSGSGQGTRPLMMIGGVIAMMIAITMRANVWIFIPLCWQAGALLGLPLRNISILYAFLVFLILKALKIVRTKLSYGWLDILLLLNLCYIAILFIKKPVGVLMFLNSDIVGGRPYFEILSAALACWVLGHVTMSPAFAKKLPIISIAANCCFTALDAIAFHIPATAPLLTRLRGGSAESAAGSYLAEESVDSQTREQFLAPVASALMRALCSYFPALSLFNPLNIGRFIILLLSCVSALQSGHRIAISTIVAYIVISSYLRFGFKYILKLSFIGIPFFICLIAFQGILYDLPFPAQRALSFLPGRWDYRAKAEADGSSEWRYEIWRFVWNSDKYIENRWFGDGFGISKRKLQEGAWAQLRGEDSSVTQENLANSGDYHSGPLSSIKFAGFVGSSLFLLLMLGNAGFSWWLALKTKDTPFFPAALFFACETIYNPVRFILIFGDYKSGVPEMFYTVAMLNLIHRSYVAWRVETNGKNQGIEVPTASPAHPFPEPVSAWPRRPALS